jgi:hypothetical protein
MKFLHVNSRFCRGDSQRLRFPGKKERVPEVNGSKFSSRVAFNDFPSEFKP